jgi:sugar phosphate isomerase/epimerase
MDNAMSTRRQFLLNSAAVSAAALVPRRLHALAPLNIPLGLQLYTVREAAEHDLAPLLKQIRAIGYTEVETYWNVYTHSAHDLRAMIADAGLGVPSGHFDYAEFEGKFDYAHELGVQWMVCPMLPPAQWGSAEGFRKAAADFNRWGARAQKLGMRFAFHNHNYEFRKFDSDTGYDILLQETDPALVSLEMDCYWMTQAGNDPLAMLKKLGSRIKMLHLKDRLPGFATSQMLDDKAGHFTEVGAGTIHWRPILDAAQKLGVEHYFVEQDHTAGPALDSARMSYNNLRKILS